MYVQLIKHTQAATRKALADKAAAAAALGDEHALPPSSAPAVVDDDSELQPHPFDAVVDNSCGDSLSIPELPLNQRAALVAQTMRHHCSSGDIQTAAHIVLALGVDGLAACKITEHEAMSVLLEQLGFDCEAARILKGCSYPLLNDKSQMSTSVYVLCGSCKKPMEGSAVKCSNCHVSGFTCAVCRLPVTGLVHACGGCGHGGHIECVRSWFKSGRKCPHGCGHSCFPTI